VVLPRQPKQERSRRKQADLLDAAERLFAERGFDAVTVDDIAAEAGYASATFYNYFSDKTQVFILVADRHVPAVVPVLGPILESFQRGDAVRGAIRESLARLVANRVEFPWLRKDWRALTLTDPQVRTYQRTLDHLWDKDLTAVLRAGVDAGVLVTDDPETAAKVVRVVVDTLADEMVMNADLDTERALDVVCALLTDGLVR
jgi:AcrR family transcriptional regulator